MTYYYEINKEFLQGLEAAYGLPNSVITRSWSTVSTSLNGLYVVIESIEALDENILQVNSMTRAEAKTLVSSNKYYLEEL